MSTCSLQINLAPNDYRHAKYILPHQIKTFTSQVDEIVLVLDTHRSKGRFGHNWDENLVNIKNLIEEQCLTHNKVWATEVDYSEAISKKIARLFFGSDFIPKKDYRGGPFYSYFFGIYDCRSKYVLHLDSDIFLGGSSSSWIKEAVNLLSSDGNIFTCSPLPGPPHPDNILVNQSSAVKLNETFKFKFSGMSTRIFMVDKTVFNTRKLKLSSPGTANSLKAIIKRNQPYDLPEHIISRYMLANDLHRIDFLGTKPGMWSLHPPFRNEAFYENLPALIDKIETDNIPLAQRGFYDINDSMINWDDAREKIRQASMKRKLLKSLGIK